MFQSTSGGDGLFEERSAVALGFVTLAFALATFVSCRSCLTFLGRLGIKNLTETRRYRAFYRYHGYYWSAFLITLPVHLILALVHTGLPMAGDPDAPVHWVILSFALASVVSTGVVFSSCRSLVRVFALMMKRRPLINPSYRVFYGYHAYFWAVLMLAIAGHFAAANVHIGFWPK